VESAAGVDAFVAELNDRLVSRIKKAGFGRYLRRSLHRNEHIQKFVKSWMLTPQQQHPDNAL
jgi:hypothetical protein